MRLLTLASLVAAAAAQSDLASTLASQDDLSTLLSVLQGLPDLVDALSSATNITIFAPTNDAFDSVPEDSAIGQAIANNDTTAISALLSNHVYQGQYPADAVMETPVWIQSLLDDSYVSDGMPFSNFTGGQYSGVVLDGDNVVVISGDLTLSTVTEADIMVGDSVIVHKIDKPIAFSPTLVDYTRRDGLLNFNAALATADLPVNFGDDSDKMSISDFTIFVPNDAAFAAIGSVLEGADLKTLQDVLTYHLVADNVVFSTALGNVSLPSYQGADLTFTVADDGSAWVNDAKIVFPNVLLANGVAHIIDGVLNPADAPFDRADIMPEADASDRVAFENATPVSMLPFSTTTPEMSYTTPELLQTYAAVAADGDMEATMTSDMGGDSTGEPSSVPTDSGAVKMMTGGVLAGAMLVSMLMI
ncbi:FAS1 domain-containing protein [Emericellopsis atlantica]|uniref:FAS1 domain-containing protein n=1 Tax=Emericellopsis atlantica TaxID=2614577 RepID=A0A9P7ZLU7_9HYPO|nr:FAS1 domain-containing protein [Emericellopsis atlantica]KAG9254494.1 FAS1 domain-containing protein [Emericellopsis atlantica]